MKLLKKNISVYNFMAAFLPPVAWAIIIFLFSSQSVLPGFETSFFDFVFKKSAHIFVYLMLYLLFFNAVHSTISKKYTKTLIFLPILLCLSYAISDEVHQTFVPGRYGTLRDIGYDMLGVSLAFLYKYKYI